jgi:hypothetical protein
MFADWMHDRLELYPGARHYVTGGDLPQLKRGFLQTMRQLLTDHGIEFRYLSNDGIIRLANGAQLEPLSAQIQDRILSTEADTLLLEEPQTWDGGRDTFDLVMSRLSGSPQALASYGPGACVPMMRMSFNPVQKGHWIYDLLEKQKAMKWWRFSVRDNFLWPGRDQYVALQEKLLPPELWAVHLDGHWSTTGGSVYRFFDQDIHGVAVSGLPPIGLRQAPLLWSFDFNVGFQCSVIAQAYVQQPIVDYRGHPQPQQSLPVPDWQRRIFYAIDEIAMPDAGVEDVVPEFLRRYEDHAKRWGVTIYGDATAGGRSQLISAQSSVRTNWKFIRSELLRRKIPVKFCVPEANPSEGDRINEVNAQFRTGAGFGTLVDMERCPVLVNDWLAVQFKPGTNQIEKKTNPAAAARLTHMCLARGTLISSEAGLTPIERIRVGQRVWTRTGLRTVTASLLTRRDAATVRVTFSNGAVLDATDTHPIYSADRGEFVAAADLLPGEQCLKLETRIPLYSPAEAIRGLHRAATGERVGGRPQKRTISIGMSGNQLMGKSLPAGMSTILTEIRQTTRSSILNVCLPQNTSLNITKCVARGAESASAMATWIASESLPKLGTRVLRESNGTEIMASGHGLRARTSNGAASNAESALLLKTTDQTLNTVAVSVRAQRAQPLALTMKRAPAPTVARRSPSTGISRPSVAVVRVVEVVHGANADVFDLTVAEDHEFFANGVLVSNSDAWGYMVFTERRLEAGMKLTWAGWTMGR